MPLLPTGHKTLVPAQPEHIIINHFRRKALAEKVSDDSLAVNSEVEVVKMTGTFYDMDEWLQLISKKDRELSEGAQWWLSRIKAKTENIS